MGKLERARIYVMPADAAGKGAKDATSAIDVCFNPKEYSLDKQVGWDAEKAFSDAPNPEFKQPNPMTLSVTLQFDTYEERVSVRDKWVRQIEALTMMKKQLSPNASAKDKAENRPPTILVLDFAIDSGKDQSFSKTAESQQVSVGPNDRLDLIAAKHLGDAGRWAEIAAYNDIVDPGNIAGADGKRKSQLQLPKD